MIKKTIVIILSCFVASFAHAEEKDDYDNFNSDGQSYEKFNGSADDVFRDWNNVLAKLSERGVNINAVDWKLIEDKCRVEERDSPKYKIFKCKYNNAVEYDKYNNDKKYCNSVSEQSYYKYQKNSKRSGEPKVLNSADEIKFKNSAVTVCMRKMGWKNPSFWNSRNLELNKESK